MKKKILLLIFFIILSSNNISHSQNIIIKYKVDNEIITNIDIKREMKYLSSLNTQLKAVSSIQLKKIAINSLIKETIKKNELRKYPNFEKKNPYRKEMIKNLYKVLKFSNEEEFKKYLNDNGFSINEVSEKLSIESNWNELIYQKFGHQVKIDRSKIDEKIKKIKLNSKIKKFLLSEILFDQSKEVSIENKTKKVLESIKEIGFENTANIYSISGSSKLGGSIGWIEERQLSKKILDNLSNINIMDITKPIKINNNFLILRLDDLKEEEGKINDDDIFNKVVQFEGDRQLNQFSKIYYNKIKINTVISEI